MIAVDDVQTVLILGAGTMGQQIAWQCATHDYDVTLYDVDEDAIEQARDQLRQFADDFIDGGRLSREEADAALDRIAITTESERAGADADLLIECVPETPELKRDVFAHFADICPERTIFATNTSTLVPSMFADATGRPPQFAALHFHLDVWTSNVVDVMPHAGTDDATIDTLRVFAVRIGQIPIVLEKEAYGYVYNSMLNALTREALRLVADDIASPKDVDRAWIGVMKMPIGPFGILDKVGLDTALDISEYWANILDDEQLHANAGLLREYVEAGKHGVKSGEGFYEYPEPAFADPDFLGGDGEQ